MISPTIESMCALWKSQDRPPFKGELIDDDGCCCAQGQVLRCGGYTDLQLRELTQYNADREVAKLLGISASHSVLLRWINDRVDGSPQDVLEHPEKFLGEHAQLVLAFWKHLDQVDCFIAIHNAKLIGWTIAKDFADDAAENADGTDDWETAGHAAAEFAINNKYPLDGVAAMHATREIQGHERLTSDLFFLPILGINSIEELKAMAGGSNSRTSL